MNRLKSGSFGSLFLWFFLPAFCLAAAACGKTTVGPTPRSEELISLKISSLPTKMTYTVGEAFDPAGIAVEGFFVDGSSRPIPDEDLVFGGFDSSVPAENQQVTVTYGGYTTGFAVTIIP